MWILLLHIIAFGNIIHEKEDLCYSLTLRSIKERAKEISEYIKENKFLTLPSLRTKLMEDALETCIDSITPEDLIFLRKDSMLHLDNYQNLTNVPLQKYKNLQDVKVSNSFLEKRSEITKRIALNLRDYNL